MYVILALLTLAFYLPWPLDLIVSAIAFLIGLFGGIKDFRSPESAPNPGNPLDVNENLGTLTNGDLVVVKGEWIYDSLHAGWHETTRSGIARSFARWRRSPCRTARRSIGRTTSCSIPRRVWPSILFSASVESYRQVWCGLIGDGETAEEDGSHDDPKNQWEIHPLVDGCKPPIIIL